MSAVEELQKVGFENAVTLERLLQDREDEAAGSIRSVVILDEAGMVSARQMAIFFVSPRSCSLRVIFSGDTKQIQSVEAGDALRILEKESKVKTFALTQVQRQTKRDYRDAIQELRHHPERGFAKLAAIGAVREVALANRAEAVAEAYAEGGDRTSLVVCATHDEIDRVTEAIRDQRKKVWRTRARRQSSAAFRLVDRGAENGLPEFPTWPDPGISRRGQGHFETRIDGSSARGQQRDCSAHGCGDRADADRQTSQEFRSLSRRS